MGRGDRCGGYSLPAYTPGDRRGDFRGLRSHPRHHAHRGDVLKCYRGTTVGAPPHGRIPESTNDRAMLKTLALLSLGAALYAPIGAVGAAAIGFAADTVGAVNAATERRCATYNSVLPGSCQLP